MNVKRRYWMFKAPIELKLKLDKVRIERIKKGKDVEIQPYKRLGLAISRHNKLIEDLIMADLKEENGKKK
jgi:hypothetical protein